MKFAHSNSTILPYLRSWILMFGLVISVLVRGEELWMYYTGIKYQTGGYLAPADHPHTPDEAAICLATLRIDGWASMDHWDYTSMNSNGTLVTAAFVAPPSSFEVWVNLRAPFNASVVQVELLRGGRVVATSEEGSQCSGCALQEDDRVCRFRGGGRGGFSAAFHGSTR